MQNIGDLKRRAVSPCGAREITSSTHINTPRRAIYSGRAIGSNLNRSWFLRSPSGRGAGEIGGDASPPLAASGGPRAGSSFCPFLHPPVLTPDWDYAVWFFAMVNLHPQFHGVTHRSGHRGLLFRGSIDLSAS